MVILHHVPLPVKRAESSGLHFLHGKQAASDHPGGPGTVPVDRSSSLWWRTPRKRIVENLPSSRRLGGRSESVGEEGHGAPPGWGERRGEARARVRGLRYWPPRLEPAVLIRAGVAVGGSDSVSCLTLPYDCTQGAAPNGAQRHSPVSAEEAWARIRGRRDWPPRLEPGVLIRAGVAVGGSEGVSCLTLWRDCTQGAARIRTGDRGFAVLCLTTWPRRRMENGEARLLRVEPPHRSERETGLEPATPTLARWCSTN
jgi:hypothetical protein